MVMLDTDSLQFMVDFELDERLIILEKVNVWHQFSQNVLSTTDLNVLVDNIMELFTDPSKVEAQK